MKVGIITIHRSTNYGGSLQAYALFKAIQAMGIDCEIIDLYRPVHPGYKYSPSYPRLISEKDTKVGLIGKFKALYNEYRTNCYNKRHNTELAKKQKKFALLCSEMKFSKAYTSVDALYSEPPSYDIFITGSDQVWNPTMRYNIEPYFLTFAPSSAKKISYAASIGLSDMPEKIKKLYSCWLSQYDFISVREENAKSLIQEIISGKDVSVVCDPTLLISQEKWKSISVKPSINNFLLCFTLSYNPDLYHYSKQVAESKGLKLVVFSHDYRDDTYKGADKFVFDAGPKEWIGWIENADVVITDSFHATLFSLMCRKSFLTYISPKNKRGSRIREILNKVDLCDHIIQDLTKQKDFEVKDYQNVWNSLDIFVQSSIQYLQKALSL